MLRLLEEASGHEPEEKKWTDILNWETSVLFLVFAAITTAWSLLVAVLSFINLTLSGRNAFWLQRLKDEVLALGVITLVLIVAEVPLSSICVDHTEWNTHRRDKEDHCPRGRQLLFTEEQIKQAHILLFGVAVTHICYTSLSLGCCLWRMRSWRQWEREAKDGEFNDIGTAQLRADLKGTRYRHAACMFIEAVTIHTTSQATYTLMRLLFRVRLEAQMQLQQQELKTSHKANIHAMRRINFLNVVTQRMEQEFCASAQHSWVLLFVMAFILLIPHQAWTIYWLAGLGLAAVLVMSAKLRSIMVVLGAAAHIEFGQELAAMMKELDRHYKHHHHRQQRPGAGGLSPPGQAAGSRQDRGQHCPSSPSQAALSSRGWSAAYGGSSREAGPGFFRGVSQRLFGRPGGHAPSGGMGSTHRPWAGAAEGQRQLAGQGRGPEDLEAQHPPPQADLEGPTALSGSSLNAGVAPAPASLPPLGQHPPTPGDGSLVSGETQGGGWGGRPPASAADQHSPATGVFAPRHPARLAAGHDPAAPAHDLEQGGSVRGQSHLNVAAIVNLHSDETQADLGLKLHGGDDIHTFARTFKQNVDVSLHLKPDRGQAGSAKPVFWMGGPTLITWLFQLTYMQNALCITLIVFWLITDKEGYLEAQHGWGPVVTVLVVDILLAVYMSWHVLPVFALVDTVANDNPRKLLYEIQKAKAAESNEQHEEGIGGLILSGLFLRVCCGVRKRRADATATSASHAFFVAALARHAGVIASTENAKQAQEEAHPGAEHAVELYREFMTFWLNRQRRGAGPSRQGSAFPQTVFHAARPAGGGQEGPGPLDGAAAGLHDRAAAWSQAEQQSAPVPEGHPVPSGATPEQDGGEQRHVLQTDVTLFQDAFYALDTNGSGGISARELANALRDMGTRATMEELEDMVHDLDADENGNIDFFEFMSFLVFVYLDFDGDGYLTPRDILRAAAQLKVPLHDAREAYDMIMLVDNDNRGRVELDEFVEFFTDHITLGDVGASRLVNGNKSLQGRVGRALRKVMARDSKESSVGAATAANTAAKDSSSGADKPFSM